MQLCFRYEENLKELHDPMQPDVVTERTRCGKVLSDGSRCRLLAPFGCFAGGYCGWRCDGCNSCRSAQWVQQGGFSFCDACFSGVRAC